MNLYKNSRFHKLAIGEIDIKGMGILKVIGIELLVQLMLSIIGAVPLLVEESMYGKDFIGFTWFGTIVNDIIIQAIVLILIIKWFSTESNRNSLIRTKIELTKKDYFYAAIVITSVSLIRYGVLDRALESLPYLIPDELIKMLEEMLTNVSPAILLVQTVLIAGFFEEVLYRGIFLNGMLKKYSPKKAIIISSLVFGFVHLNLPQGLNAFVLGLIFGGVYYYTRSLYICMFMHGFNNLIVNFIYVPENTALKIALYVIVPIIGILLILKAKKELDLKERYKNAEEEVIEEFRIINERANTVEEEIGLNESIINAEIINKDL